MAYESRLEILRQVFQNNMLPEVGLRLYKQDIMKQKNKKVEKQDIAVIGISGRFPGAENVTELWEELSSGSSSIQTADRWNLEQIYNREPGKAGKTYAKWGGFLSNIYEFDPMFFELSPRQAEFMEPRQRLFLEEAWNALENSGYSAPLLKGTKCGVFLGSEGSTHYFEHLKKESMNAQAFLGNSNAVLASRISYFLDLQGPALTVDTACSSSLSAVHLACRSIQNGECEMALAGGIHLIESKESYILLSSMGMLSKEGKCKAFDEEADGFVPGEAVGVVVLKPYEKAVEDGDYIYGIIKGSGMNQDGKTNGITAPNQGSQIRLIRQIYQENGINPETISYVEAHGTGTKLGDPIEFQALNEVYGANGGKGAFCGIGSIKSNIGHTAAASGICGLIKILLSMQKKELPATLHVKRVNQLMDLDNSPFYLVTKLKQWKTEQLPRRAALSSFGHGGTNCHIVVEENLTHNQRIHNNSRPEYLIPISGKTEEALQRKQKELCQWLKGNMDKDIRDISFTLCMGRTHFKVRNVFLVREKEMLVKALEEAERKPENGHLYGRESALDDSMLHMAQIYLESGVLDDKLLFGDMKCYRIPLPSYPFSNKSYQLPEEVLEKKNEMMSESSIHYSLIDKAEPVENGVCYWKHFTGKEFFIKDHSSIVPAVVYLEMARQAGTLLCGNMNQVAEIENMVFIKPFVIKEPVEVRFEVHPTARGAKFTIGKIESGTAIVYAQGSFSYAEGESETEKYKNSTYALAGGSQEAEKYYEKMLSHGSFLGKRFQGMREFYWNQENAKCRLDILEEAADSISSFGMHPVLLDGGIQSAVCWSYHLGADQDKIYLPFTIRTLKIRNPLSKICNAYLKVQAADGKFSAETAKFQITYTNQDDEIVAEMKDVTVRGFHSGINAGEENKSNILYLEESYEPCECMSQMRKTGENILVLRGEKLDFQNENTEKKLMQKLGENKHKQIIYMFPEQREWDIKTLNDWLKHGILNVIRLLKVMSWTGEVDGMLLLVYPMQKKGKNITAGYLDGFLQSLRQEKFPVMIRTVGVEKEFYDGTQSELIEMLSKEFTVPFEMDCSVVYMNRMRYTKSLQEQKKISSAKAGCYVKEEGVYLITGGTGGIGFLFAKKFAAMKNVTLILLGRSRISKEIENKLQILDKLGANAVYVTADVSKKEELEKIVQNIKDKYNRLNGILHCAGTVSDQLFEKKSEEAMKNTFVPKIQGTVALWETVKKEKLDFITLFSSTTAVIGNAGQADYAFANGFLNSFVKQIQQERPDVKAVSICWPLWQNGGMQMGKESQKLLKHLYGITPITKEEGFEIWQNTFESEESQVIVLAGEKEKIRRNILGMQKKEKKIICIEKNTQREYEVFTQEFLRLIAEIMKINQEEIDIHTKMSEYGFDSILFTELANRVNDKFCLQITPAVFFGHSTPESIAEELYREHKGELSIVAAEAEEYMLEETGDCTAMEKEAVAIIGISGKMPDAENVEEYWEHLNEKKDSVREIPKERWDYKEYEGKTNTESGKNGTKWGAFLKRVDCFDPLFFHILPSDAETMDPQARLIIEETWKAIENAGYKPSSLSQSRTGVFIGVTNSDYKEKMLKDGVLTAASNGFIASQISYLFDFNGPSESVDTACSSSLVAIHKAVKEIQSGQCEMAVAGGVNLMLSPNVSIVENRNGMLAPDGKCKTFDAAADGYVRGEGAGVILLKPLKAAQRDGDYIYGVIRGTAVSNNGHGNAITVPSSTAQADAIIRACRQAKINPSTVSYIEAHGTGTKLGDPVEIEGLRKAFSILYKEWGETFVDGDDIRIGTVKTNIGHLESAAGIAGIFKVLKAMEYKKLPGLLHFKKQNPYINLSGTPFALVTDTMDWKEKRSKDGTVIPRRAGVSSFGIGGVNAHIILEEYCNRKFSFGQENKSQLIVLSAKNETRLRETALGLYKYLKKKPEKYSLTEIAYTLQVGREEMETRIAFVADTVAGLQRKLKQYFLEGKEMDSLFYGNVKKTVSNEIIQPEEDIPEKLEELARLWTEGRQINWTGLHKRKMITKAALPGYSFEKRRCWYQKKPETSKLPLWDSIENVLYQIVSEVLKLQKEEIDPDRKLTYYGLDSISTMQLINRIRTHYGVGFKELCLDETNFSFNELVFALVEYNKESNNIRDLHAVSQSSRRRIVYGEIEELRISKDIDYTKEVSGEERKQAQKILLCLIQQKTAIWKEKKELVLEAHKDNLTNEVYQQVYDHFEAISEFVKEEKYMPQSVTQAEYYFESNKNEEAGGDAINMNCYISAQVRLTGVFYPERFQKAVESILKRHEILRATFTKSRETLIQKIMPFSWKRQYEYLNIEEYENIELKRKAVEEKIKEINKQSISIQTGPNIRFFLFHISETEQIFYVIANHILFDAFSFNPLVKELVSQYEKFGTEFDQEDEQMPPQYLLYILMDDKMQKKEDEEFWKQYVKDANPILKLPFDFQKMREKKMQGSYEMLFLPEEVLTAWRKWLREHNITFFSGMLSAIGMLLSKWCKINQFMFIFPTQKRDLFILEQMIGDFNNILPVKLELEDDTTFEELAKRTQENMNLFHKHKSYPSRKISEFVKERTTKECPYCNVAVDQTVISENITFNEELSGSLIYNDSMFEKVGVFDLFIGWFEVKDGVKVAFTYHDGAFQADTIKRLQDSLAGIIGELAENPGFSRKDIRLNLLKSDEF